MAEQLQATQEQHQRDVDTFQAEKSSLQSWIDVMQRQTIGVSRNGGGQAARPEFGQLSRVAPGVRTPFAPPIVKGKPFSEYKSAASGFVYR